MRLMVKESYDEYVTEDYNEQEKKIAYSNNLREIAETIVDNKEYDFQKHLENKEFKKFLLELCGYYIMNTLDIKQIFLGFENGLSIEQIKLYTESPFEPFKSNQMIYIRLALENGFDRTKIDFEGSLVCFEGQQLAVLAMGLTNGLSNEQINVYFNTKYNGDQMNEIYLGFKNGLNKSQVEIYADEKLNSLQMEQIRFGFENGLTIEQVETYKMLKYPYNMLVRRGFEQNWSMEAISLYNNEELCEAYVWSIFEALKQIPLEHVKLFASPDFNVYKIKNLISYSLAGLNYDQMKVVAQKDLSTAQMDKVYLGFKDGLTVEQVEVFAKEEIGVEHMEIARICYKKLYNSRQIKLLMQSELDIITLTEILKTINPRIGVRKLERYIKSVRSRKLTEEQIERKLDQIRLDKIQEIIEVLTEEGDA